MKLTVYKLLGQSEQTIDLVIHFLFDDNLYKHIEPVLITPKGIHQFLSMIEKGEIDIFASYVDMLPLGFIYGRFDPDTATYFSHCCFKKNPHTLNLSKQTEALMRQIYKPKAMICNIPESNRMARFHAINMGLKKIGENKNLFWDGKTKLILYKKEYNYV